MNSKILLSGLALAVFASVCLWLSRQRSTPEYLYAQWVESGSCAVSNRYHGVGNITNILFAIREYDALKASGSRGARLLRDKLEVELSSRDSLSQARAYVVACTLNEIAHLDVKQEMASSDPQSFEKEVLYKAKSLDAIVK